MDFKDLSAESVDLSAESVDLSAESGDLLAESVDLTMDSADSRCLLFILLFCFLYIFSGDIVFDGGNHCHGDIACPYICHFYSTASSDIDAKTGKIF